ncbi:MAG: 3D domain-containing protein [Moorellaceae bacterium]
MRGRGRWKHLQAVFLLAVALPLLALKGDGKHHEAGVPRATEVVVAGEVARGSGIVPRQPDVGTTDFCWGQTVERGLTGVESGQAIDPGNPKQPAWSMAERGSDRNGRDRHAATLASRGGSPRREVKAKEVEMEVVATGYSASREEGTEDGVTAAGTRAHRGVAAADLRVIPLGSEVYVPGYGWARAEDTGGAVKGRRIDLFFPSREEALRWGVKKVRVLVRYPVE